MKKEFKPIILLSIIKLLSIFVRTLSYLSSIFQRSWFSFVHRITSRHSSSCHMVWMHRTPYISISCEVSDQAILYCASSSTWWWKLYCRTQRNQQNMGLLNWTMLCLATHVIADHHAVEVVKEFTYFGFINNGSRLDKTNASENAYFARAVITCKACLCRNQLHTRLQCLSEKHFIKYYLSRIYWERTSY